MFQLVIAIVSIALIVALVALSQFYGGSTMSDAQAQAESARVKAEEQQLLGALDMFNADHKRWPDSLQELVSGGYITSIPQGAKPQQQARAFDTSLISPAYAQAAAAAGWTMPLPGEPVFATSAVIPPEVCRKYNLMSRGDDGILKLPFEDQLAQCYGQEAYRVLVIKAGHAGAMARAVAPEQVVAGGIPSKDTGLVWWDTLPTGAIKAPVDADKVLFAELSLQSGSAENFGGVPVGQVKDSNARTVVNKGNIDATDVQVSAPPGFAVSNNTCQVSMKPGAACSFSITFAPTSTGNQSGDVVVASGNGGSKQYVVSGTGQKAVLSHTTTAANFGMVYQGDTAYSSAYTISNTGNLAMTGLSITAPTDYAITSSTCAATLNEGSNCSFVIAFTPTGTGDFNGYVTLTSSNGGSGSISVAGTGASRFSQATLVSASSITLADWYTSGTITDSFTYRNDGNQAMTLNSPSLSSPLSVVGNTCTNVPAGATCAIAVALTRNANTGGSGAQSFVAAGAAVAPAQVTTNWSIYSVISRWGGVSLEFGNVQVGQSTTRSLTLYNDGSVAQNWASNNSMANVPAGFSFNLSGCSNVAPNGGSCTVDITFTPPGATSYGGSSIYPTAASINSNTLTVNGSGAAPTATLTSSLAYGNVSSGSVSDKTATLSNTGVVPIAVGSPTVSGTGFSIVGNTCSSNLAASTSCNITVRYTASGTSTGSGTLSVATDAGTKTASVSGQSTIYIVDAGGYYRYSDGSVASSCLDYRNGGTGRSAGPLSGVYMVNMGGGNEQVYCDQSYNGGGWTLVARTGAYQSGGFGWYSAGGSLGDQSGSYSLGVLSKGLNFSQILFGDRSGNSIGSRAYINNVSKGTLAGASNSMVAVGVPSGPGYFAMAQMMGFTSESSTFFFRDCCGSPGSYGLFPTVWLTAYGDGYTDISGQPANAAYGGFLNNVSSGIIFVR